MELPMMSRLVFCSMKPAIERDSYPSASGYQKVEKPSSSILLSKCLIPAPSNRSIGYQTPNLSNGLISNSWSCLENIIVGLRCFVRILRSRSPFDYIWVIDTTSFAARFEHKADARQTASQVGEWAS